MFTWEALLAEKDRRHRYYLQNRQAYAERARRREIEKSEEVRAYKARYYQEVTKKKNHGKAAITPVHKKTAERQPSRPTKPQPPANALVATLQPPRTLHWD
jgi:hypothetical protein